MPRWEVPYEPPDHTLVRYVVGTVFTLAAGLPLVVLALSDKQSVASWFFGLLLVAVFVTGVWRVALVGVWVGAQGVKVSTVIRTRVVRWPDLGRVWLGPATGFDALALWISDRAGAEIETPVWRAGSRAGHRNRAKLEQHELSALIERLRAGARPYT